MRLPDFTSLLAVIVATVMLCSCDPLSSVEYKIRNMSTDTVEVTFYKEIMLSNYHGYTIQVNDTLTVHHEDDSCLVAVLAPSQLLWSQHEWHGLYREELIVPMYIYIKSITIGGTELPRESWNDVSKWKLKSTGGNFGQGESRYYDLWIQKK